MIELPEARVLSDQLNEVLNRKSVKEVIAGQSPHKFAWLSGDSAFYNEVLAGKSVTDVKPIAGFVEVQLGEAKLMFTEGIKCQYFQAGEKLPKKHQLLVTFDDESSLTASVQMYGGMTCSSGEVDNEYYQVALSKPTPFSEAFTYDYFTSVVCDEALTNKSAKEVLATKQRIPGLGNGVLQDILFNAKIHPKRKMKTLSENQLKGLYESVIGTLNEMTTLGGRDTEKDLFGCVGQYKTKVSKMTVDQPCEICGTLIQKKAYMGGSVYFCETCQPEK